MKDTIFDESEEDDSLENVAAEQMHHSVKTASLTYARERQNMSNFQISKEQAFLNFSLQYHAFFQLNNSAFAFLKSHHLPSTFKSLSVPVKGLSSTADALKTRRKHALSLTSSFSPMAPKKVKLTDVSSYLSLVDNYRFNSTPDGGNMQENTTVNPDYDQIMLFKTPAESQSTSVSVFQSDVLESLLQDFFSDSTVAFKSYFQKLALQLIMQKTPCLTIILPTAGGKSTLFLLTASFAMSKTTIVVVPLVSLKMDLKRRALEFNISCFFWEDRKESTTDGLILVSAESAVTPEFFSFVQELHLQHKLDRIIFDEAHLIPLTSGYRHVMYGLKQLRMIPTQFVFLTATLNQNNETKLHRMMLLSNNQTIRAPVSQRKIHYQMQFFKSKLKMEHYDELLQYIIEFQSKHGEGEKILIYSMAKSEVSYLFGQNSHTFAHFHADLGQEQKESQLADFVSGRKKIMLTTGALSVGVDFSNVILVIHLYSAYSLTDFVQETGRLSRDHTRGYSTVLTTKSELIFREKDEQERKYMRQYLNEQICRRRTLNLIFDDVISDECHTDEAACDLCVLRGTEKMQIQNDASHHIQKVTARRNRLIQAAKSLQEHCVICFFQKCVYANLLQGKGLSRIKHSVDDCPEQIENMNYLKQMRRFRQFNLAKGSCCFKCLLPNVVCKNNAEIQGQCDYPDIILYFLIGFFKYSGDMVSELGLSEGLEDFTEISNMEAFFQHSIKVETEYFGTESLEINRLFTLLIPVWMRTYRANNVARFG